MRSTFRQSDVVLLLKDISGLVEPLPAEVIAENLRSKERSEIMSTGTI